MEKIYRNPTYPTVDYPIVDLLTLLFDSEHCLATDDTVLHLSADNPTRSLTKSQLRDLTQRIAYSLRNHHGIGAAGPNKDVVTVMTYGQPIAPAVFFGVLAAAGVYSAASPSLTCEELVRQLRLGQSRLIICSSEVEKVARKAAYECRLPPENVLVVESDPTWALRRMRGFSSQDLLTDDKLEWKACQDDRQLRYSLIAIVWSSGTTGVPKGVMISHTNLVVQTFITHYQGREAAYKQIEEGTFVEQENRTLAHLPSSHISGLFGYFISPFYGGGTVVWMRRYDWTRFLQYARQYKITNLFTVPSIWLRVSKSADVTDQFSHLVGASTGSAPMDSALQRMASTKLGIGEDAMIGPSWGLTETTGGVTITLNLQNDEKGTLGQILPGLEIRLVNDDFQDVHEGDRGELLVRGPTVMNGYYNNPAATRNTFHHDWLCTGDIAIRRKGRFYMVDRKKELIKYKGLQIAPAELEGVLVTHPAIQEAAVIGVRSLEDPSSELPRAYVVRAVDAICSTEELASAPGTLDSRKKEITSSPPNVTEADVQMYVKDRLSPYKQLRGGVVFVKDIPKNATGKILRKELRERAAVEAARVEGSKDMGVEGAGDLDRATLMRLDPEKSLNENPKVTQEKVSMQAQLGAKL